MPTASDNTAPNTTSSGKCTPITGREAAMSRAIIIITMPKGRLMYIHASAIITAQAV